MRETICNIKFSTSRDHVEGSVWNDLYIHHAKKFVARVQYIEQETGGVATATTSNNRLFSER